MSPKFIAKSGTLKAFSGIKKQGFTVLRLDSHVEYVYEITFYFTSEYSDDC